MIHQTPYRLHPDWPANEQASPDDVRHEMHDADLERLADRIAAKTRRDDPDADGVPSGLILTALADHGYSICFEGLLEQRAEAALAHR